MNERACAGQASSKTHRTQTCIQFEDTHPKRRFISQFSCVCPESDHKRTKTSIAPLPDGASKSNILSGAYAATTASTKWTDIIAKTTLTAWRRSRDWSTANSRRDTPPSLLEPPTERTQHSCHLLCRLTISYTFPLWWLTPKCRSIFRGRVRANFCTNEPNAHPDYPVTIYYAFKQSETTDEQGTASAGWETMLEGLIEAGFQITGTWPMRSEMATRMVASQTNALASCIVLVCRLRPESASSVTRTQFLRELRRELPEALHTMQHGNIAPVDFAQSAIGPGMGVFSRYSKVTELDGTRLSVREALKIINKTLDEVLSEQEGETDAETRWAIAWYSQNSWDEAK